MIALRAVKGLKMTIEYLCCFRVLFENYSSHMKANKTLKLPKKIIILTNFLVNSLKVGKKFGKFFFLLLI